MKPKRLKYFSIPNQIYYVFAQLLGRSKGPPFLGVPTLQKHEGFCRQPNDPGGDPKGDPAGDPGDDPGGDFEVTQEVTWEVT